MKTIRPPVREWDVYEERDGIRVGQYEVSKSKDNPIVLVGGLGSTPDSMKAFAESMSRLSGTTVAAVDVLPADELKAIDNKTLFPPALRLAQNALALTGFVTGTTQMTDIMSQRLPFARWYDMDHFTDLIDQTVDRHVTKGPWDVVAHSWGAAAALKMMTNKHMSEQIEKAAMISPVPLRAVQFPSPAVLEMMAWSDRSPERLLQMGGDLYGGDIRRDPQIVLEHALSRDVDPEAYERQVRALGSIIMYPWMLPMIEQPMVVIGSTDDPITPLINSFFLSKMIPGAELQVVRGGGHMFYATRPDETAQRVATFFDTQRKRRARVRS